MRLIDKDALLKELGISDEECKKCDRGYRNGYCTMSSDWTFACDAICTAPTIEERKQGEWIYGERKRLTDLGYITEKYWKCSACGNAKGFRAIKPLDNFCLFCGADMRGEEHED